MKTVFIGDLKPLADALAGDMAVYVPKKVEEHYVYDKYDSTENGAVEFNPIRVCATAKEFLFPARELAATYPSPVDTVDDIEPFAVFGLKECDLRSMRILDKVFAEDEFEDESYTKRREKMFVISADCTEPGESCFCNLFEGRGFAAGGFDLNVSEVKGGFIVEAGSQVGEEFLAKHSQMFADPSTDSLAERDEKRQRTEEQLKESNATLRFSVPLRDIVEGCQDSEICDVEAKNCVECQACTRVCPTCHCFYLYDTRHEDYFAKMKMWDSCMRQSYAEVAGGANPNKVLGDRVKHRLMHKFVHFLDRYGIDMCVGCGRCVDGCAGETDIREVLKKLSEEAVRA